MNFIKTTLAAILSTLLLASPALALSASVGASANASAGSATVSAKVQARIATAKNRADQEIDRRISVLTKLSADVQGMMKVSESEKSAIATEVQTEITDLTTLKAKIDADTDVKTLRADIKSIVQGYRIYMLVIPQGRIEVVADKIQTVVSSYTAFSATLQARIAQVPAGTNTSQETAWLSDMNAKVDDASTRAQAAVSLVANLQPDQGSASVLASNKAALQNARADLKTAFSDLKAARQDAGNIVSSIRSWKVSASASSTVSTQ